jgi:hypothetical protein
VHKTCRSCHVPPSQPEGNTVITDCAVCHGPEQPPRSLYKLLPARSAHLLVHLEDSVPAGRHDGFRKKLRDALDESAITVTEEPGPDTVPVAITVSLEIGEGRTDRGRAFVAAVARAVVRMHRTRVEVRGRQGVGAEAAEAVTEALDDVLERVVLVLTW